MKKIPALCLSVFLLSTLAACGGAQASKDDSKPNKTTEINVCNWGEYIDKDVLDTFESETGIHVNYQTIDNNEKMYAKIKSGGVSFDVIVPSDYMISRMISEDMLEKLDYNNIPNFEDIRDDLRNPAYDTKNEYSVPYTWGIVGIIYDKKQVTEPVDSWNILWNEKYSGQILMFDNSRDAIGIALKKLGYSVNTTNEAELKAAADELIKQKPLVQAYVMDQIFDKMGGGEALLAPYYAGDAITMMDENPDLAFAVPKEGTNRFVDAMCIPKGSPNKAAAEEFINFMTRADIAQKNIEYIGYSTPSTNVFDNLDSDIQRSVSYPSEDILKNTEPFLNLPENILALYDQLWIEILK